MGEINQLKYNFNNLTLLPEILFLHLILKLNCFSVSIKRTLQNIFLYIFGRLNFQAWLFYFIFFYLKNFFKSMIILITKDKNHICNFAKCTSNLFFLRTRQWVSILYQETNVHVWLVFKSLIIYFKLGVHLKCQKKGL